MRSPVRIWSSAWKNRQKWRFFLAFWGDFAIEMQETLSDPAFLLTSGFHGNFSGNFDSRKGAKKAGNTRLFGLVHAATFRAIFASANAICPLDGAYGLMCSTAAFDVILERHGRERSRNRSNARFKTFFVSPVAAAFWRARRSRYRSSSLSRAFFSRSSSMLISFGSSAFFRLTMALGKPPREIQASRVNASALRRRLFGEGRGRGRRFPAQIPHCGLRKVECERRLREVGKSPREIQASRVSASALRRRLREAGKPPREIQASRVSASALRRRLFGEGRRRSRRFPARIPNCGLRKIECVRRLREVGKPPL